MNKEVFVVEFPRNKTKGTEITRYDILCVLYESGKRTLYMESRNMSGSCVMEHIVRVDEQGIRSRAEETMEIKLKETRKASVSKLYKTRNFEAALKWCLFSSSVSASMEELSISTHKPICIDDVCDSDIIAFTSFEDGITRKMFYKTEYSNKLASLVKNQRAGSNHDPDIRKCLRFLDAFNRRGEISDVLIFKDFEDAQNWVFGKIDC